jgi:predicted Zn-dependent protease
MQGLYQRRTHSKKAIPHLLEARKGLKKYVKQYSSDGLAWQLLSQAEEHLLNYNAALTALQNAVSLNKKDKISSI